MTVGIFYSFFRYIGHIDLQIIEGKEDESLSDFTHFNKQARAKMVDISEKKMTTRKAIAHASIQMNTEVYESIVYQRNKKGDVLAVAQVAGIMGAKQTSALIPMCHPILISGVDLQFNWNPIDNNQYELSIESEVKTNGNTGVEMEALTAVSIAALAIYDMCKSIDKSLVIGPTYLLQKSGGKSGIYIREKNK